MSTAHCANFICDNGHCIKGERCDGVTDCEDGSDEELCGKYICLNQSKTDE